MSAIPKKVYICFDYDQDKALKELLVGQAMNEGTPFEILDNSLHEAVRERAWEEKAKFNINKADTVIVLLGPKTHRAPGVLKEVKMARDLGKRVIQLVAHKDGACTRVPGGGVLYRWTWQNLTKILSKEKKARNKCSTRRRSTQA